MFSLFQKFFFIVMICSFRQTAFPIGNDTYLTPFSSLNYGASKLTETEYPGGYNGNDFYDFPKQPPFSQGFFVGLYNSFWLAPVLRYLVSVNDGSVQLQANPSTILLPVALAAANHWWFHEQQVRELLYDRGETVVGDPVLIAELVDGGDGDKASKTSSATSANKQQDSSQQVTPPTLPTSSLSSQSNGQDEKGNEAHHLCGGQPCPVCNYKPCHCLECSGSLELADESEAVAALQDNKRKSETIEAEPPKKKLRTGENNKTTSVVRVPSTTANIVSLLWQRRVTGNLHSSNNPLLAQAALEARGSGEPEVILTGQAYRRQPCTRSLYDFIDIHQHTYCSVECFIAREVLVLSDTALLSWAGGGLKIWTNKHEEWSYLDVPVSEYNIRNVFIINETYLVILLEKNTLQEWKKRGGNWKGYDIANGVSLIEQLTTNEFVTFTKNNNSLGVWSCSGRFWSFTELTKLDDTKQFLEQITIISNTQFIIQILSKEFFYGWADITHFQRWSKTGHNWVSETYFQIEEKSSSMVKATNGGNCIFFLSLSNSLMIWTKKSNNWVEIPRMTVNDFNYGSEAYNILSDGRIYMKQPLYNQAFPEAPENSLLVLTEAESGWEHSIVHLCPERRHYSYKVQNLNDGRLIVAINDSAYNQPFKSVLRVFLQNRGIWDSIILGTNDSAVIGMTLFHENKLITRHLDGTIKIWNLYP